MTVLLLLVAGWCGFLGGVGATLWWVSRNSLEGDGPPAEDPHKW